MLPKPLIGVLPVVVKIRSPLAFSRSAVNSASVGPDRCTM
jgi:hypothetical protein